MRLRFLSMGGNNRDMIGAYQGQFIFIDRGGVERVVFCPESVGSSATLSPGRGSIAEAPEDGGPKSGAIKLAAKPAAMPDQAMVTATASPGAGAAARAATGGPAASEVESGPKERHFRIFYGDTGCSYESLFGDVLKGAKSVELEDPYIRSPHQCQNFTRFCELVAKIGAAERIKLITGTDDPAQKREAAERFDSLKESMANFGIVFEYKFADNLHDREVRLSNGWRIKIGRGLDIYQKPESWFSIGAHDLTLRPCLETMVDVFRV